MNQPWQYRSANYDEKNVGFYVSNHGEIHRITVGENGELTSHEIGKDLEIRANDREVDFTTGISFYPKEFIQTKIPGLTLNTRVYLSDSIYLVYNSEGNNFHLAQSMFTKAKQMSELHKNLVYFWLHEGKIVVLAFKEKQFYMGNSYDVMNIAEVIYFVTAIMQEAKFDTMPYFLAADISELKADQMGTEFEKFGIDLQLVNSRMPYTSVKQIPDTHIATNLLIISSCALPEEF
jgi:hypothetical protein